MLTALIKCCTAFVGFVIPGSYGFFQLCFIAPNIEQKTKHCLQFNVWGMLLLKSKLLLKKSSNLRF